MLIYCAGGRSVILLKAKASFCVVEEARRRMPGDPANHYTKTALAEKDLNGARQ